MRNGWLIVAALLVGLALGFDLGGRYAQPGKVASEMKASVTPVAANTSAPSPANPNSTPAANLNSPPTATEWDEYRRTKELVFHENPQLIAEYRELMDEMNKHQEDIEAAMIKCDPKVAPLTVKLDAIRQRNMTANLAGVPK